MTLRDALDRTLLLMREEVVQGVDDSVLLAALQGTRVAIVADEANVSSHSAQSAFITAAILMARSAHQVCLLAPDVQLVGAQPPLRPGRMVEQLTRVGIDMLPNVAFTTRRPPAEFDLAVAFGDTPVNVRARYVIRLNAGRWAGRIARKDDLVRWKGGWWPLGGMAAGALAAAEAFKCAMRKLEPVARSRDRMTAVFALAEDLTFSLAPPATPAVGTLGSFDCVSGGAIASSLLFVLARIPAVKGFGRVIEPDTSDLSNLNRYPLLLRSRLGRSKASDLVELFDGALQFEAVKVRYDISTAGLMAPLAPSVLVGVDDIPTRWVVQRKAPDWLGIGATTHWSAMASFHSKTLGCAQCLHPVDDPGNALIPTVAFVSFWAGLLTAAYFVRHLAGDEPSSLEQYIYLTALRPESPFRGMVPVRNDCPTCGADLASSRDRLPVS